MTTLSRRGRALIESPPLAPYILEHFARVADLWDAQHNPDGYVPLCIAENKRCAEDLVRRLAGYGAQVPAAAMGYDAMIGSRAFRERLAAYLGRAVLGRTFAPEQLAVVAGVGTVLELLFHALADPGEGVLVPTPSYAGFWADLETRDALKVVTVDCPSEDGFRLTPARLDAAWDASPVPIRALLLTTPNNPLGCVSSRAELLEVVQWAEARGIHLVVDEIYALSVFGDTPFVSAATLRESLGPRVHLAWGFSKDFGASGLRCGVLVSENKDVIAAVDQLAYWGACSGHTQHLLAAFVSDDEAVDEYVAQSRAALGQAYARLTESLRSASIPFVAAEAGFFVICDLRSWLDAPTFEAEERLWRRMLDEARVNLTPGASCRIAEPGFFRLCFAAMPDEAVTAAVARVGRLLGS